MEARPPESEHIMPRRIFRSRAYQLAHDPESDVMMARSGSRGDSSHATRCGLTGCAATMARSSSVFHHEATLASTFLRQSLDFLALSSGSSARKVSAESPSRLTSIGK